MAFAAIALLVAGGGLYFGQPYESSRHKETIVELFPGGTVPARLWQDPFAAIARCKQNSTTEGGDIPCASGSAQTLLEPQKNGEPQEFVIMPVMVYGDAYSESVEKRRRRRYAVLSAMFMQDYQPDDAQTIGFFEYRPPPDACNASTHARKGDGREADGTRGGYAVPYEWLRPNTAHYSDEQLRGNNGRHPVLLLWLDERQFGTEPLCALRALLDAITSPLTEEGKNKARVTLLGPAGSTVLRAMVHEAIANKGGGDFFPAGWKFSIFSPVATASAKLILSDKVADISSEWASHDVKCKSIPGCGDIYADKEFKSLFLIEHAFGNIGIEFFRTIVSDKALLRMLIKEEFRNRKIEASESRDVVILVSEWDTFYGRSMPEAFIEIIKKTEDGEEGYREKNETGEICSYGVCDYGYMRGLDGEILAGQQSENERADKAGVAELERAVSVSRFDYLRRLATQIRDDFHSVPGTVRAVGVLGSDVYDKLLVLQALRPSFPNALFFTTDADARYLHPAELKWTRGLVVLSGYGLKYNRENLPESLKSYLKGESELELPPFRDSYQTSVFFAAQLAMRYSSAEFPCDGNKCGSLGSQDSLRKALAEFKVPKAFEVGRPGLVSLGEQGRSPILSVLAAGWSRLTGEGRENAQGVSSPQPPSSWLVINGVLASGVLLFYLLLRGQYGYRRATRMVSLSVLAFVVPSLVMVAVHVADGIDGELSFLWGGSNMLPTLAFLVFTLIAAILLLTMLHIELHMNAKRLIRKFRLEDTRVVDCLRPQRVSALPERLRLRRRLKLAYRRATDCVLPRRARLWLKGMTRRRTKDPSLKRRRASPESLARRWLRHRMAVAWRALNGRPHMCLQAVLHAFFCVAFISLLGDFFPPVRGAVAYHAYYGSVITALSAFFVLLYLFAHEARRCQEMACLFTAARLVWDNQALEAFARQRSIRSYGADTAGLRDGLANWASVQLLAERTQVLQKGIYYPFAVLLLLILAHNSLFDDWRLLVPSVFVVPATSVPVIVFYIWFLRRAKERVREFALTSMRQVLVGDLRDGDDGDIQSWRMMIDEVANEERGAFRPVASDPIFKALLMPLSGYGSLYLIDHLAGILQR